MTERGRKGKYESCVAPFFDKIDKMLQDGASEKQVAKALGVSESAFANYKRQHDDLRALCEKPRQKVVEDLRSALLKKALGYEYKEEKVYQRKTGDDEPEIIYKEIYKKHMPPDVAAINLALKNYDRDNWSNDPQMLEIKKQELELKKLAAETEKW